ncbi:SDR family oxidoreductase [Pseudoduganella ginsengisoli]|uniref:SDR family oxidoreductase n=1 Tax=Pseudoduganella ginsengisoli TaxID=1462440 RepID=A0A6L6Q2V1_9BURK|nr:SDR family oxidoreductase [Pseudoduganella ginsengisoli]MTW03935.1 SDR family oxidoreductase [Pseudoduganella ginsengisoli]
MSKVLIVTGGGRGIGAAIALAAARDGYAVAVNYARDAHAAGEVVQTIRAAGGQAVAIQADVGEPADVARLFADTERALGPVTALVNNAGITGRITRFMEADHAMIADVFRINVLGLMECCRAALASFQRHGIAGVIVNISSTAAASGSAGDYVHYAASKAAVEAFTLGLGREVAPQGIRVLCVAPGMTETEIHERGGDGGRLQRAAPSIPMRRVAQPEEIAAPVVWLLSPAASYMTATTVTVGGGK